MKRQLLAIAALGFSALILFYVLNKMSGDEKLEAHIHAQTPDTDVKAESQLKHSNSVVATKESDKKDSLPLVWSPRYIEAQENMQSIDYALDLLQRGSQSQKIRAFHVLMQMSPSEAVTRLHGFMAAANTEVEAAELVAHGLVGFAQSPEYLSETDLKACFSLNNNIAQKISALILEERGDASLVKRYMETKAVELNDKNPAVRSQALKEIASVGFSKAIPYALKSINDKDVGVKLDALEVLSQFATSSNIGDIQPLVNNANKEVSRYAQETINSLWNKNSSEPLSLAERLVQPGFPVGGMPLDLEEEE